MDAHALTILEFPAALERVATFASSELGAGAVHLLAPSTDPGWIGPELERVGEMIALLTRDEGWGVPVIPDARDALKRLRIDGSVLEAAQLRDIGVLLVSSRTARRALLAEREALPRVGTLAERLAERPREADSITQAIDEDGNVRDEASPELGRLRSRIRTARARIVERLTAYAASLPPQFQVPDASITVREGRYVIPVRREGRGEVGGIVHDESGTGATLFIEPPVAIEIMNGLREAQAAESREVLRILRELTDSLRPHRPELTASLDALIELDSLLARGRYARRVGGAPPTMLAPGTEEYTVVDGRHPVLLGRGDPVVPFDLQMEAGERTLLISGPNTGGKTVLLKAIGLISLLAQSGVVPPAGPGSRLPVFRAVFADIGDEQSIEASLSTFSAHLKNLGAALDGADWESLVLIDEIGSGTDPVEGAALAQAVLVELTRRSAFTIATTHLGQLKLLATEGGERGVVNASLQFDAERLQPTYRLVKGVPGRSYGIAIARRLGLPSAVLNEAEAALPRGERDIAQLLLELETRDQRLADATARLDAELATTETLRRDLERREAGLRQREEDAERRSRQQARDLLLGAREQVESAIREVRDAADAEKLAEAARAARRRVEEAAQQHRERAPKARKRAPAGRAGELTPGLRVRIESIGRTGTVLELRDGKAMIEAGGLRLLLPHAELTPLPPGDQEPANRERQRPSGGHVSADFEASPEVDLRGLRPDEVEVPLGRALDAALVSGLPTFRIIHGKGMGVLRERVGALLRSDPRVVSFRPGERFEGGTGVTVAEFA